ncbi:Chromate resistance protein ChrB [Actinocatenispora sera]|uniref:Chromate resistance protein ChrB n=1 Tax=Actinocatenispora sera TaxID=390989 RepID=UPI000691755B|nr:Chromate resistance protein ChrB [Actinocatenispora sera]
MSADESRAWLLIGYRAPAQPSTARVSTWRRLHRLGAVYVGASTCLLPAGAADDAALSALAAGVTEAGGSFDLYPIDAMSIPAHRALVARANADRDAEYAEVVERAEALVTELATESARGKFTFAEVEENEADLAKLRRWLATVGARDRYGAGGRAAAERAVDRAAQRMQEFTERSAGADHPPSVGPARPDRGR